jgi:hypothetical protein
MTDVTVVGAPSTWVYCSEAGYLHWPATSQGMSVGVLRAVLVLWLPLQGCELDDLLGPFDY